ncbi:hypothetical protein B0T19DRAFT_353670 [Cercophora scortea]|uniref:Uncharacterized protein n=1 Tax=Cercophora scortea TaxID=314031 RepID=A0AAE0IX12_9PEZI|nr:hypothetical protein B0T19DRAFT_353670 [Cercophora scortea]
MKPSLWIGTIAAAALGAQATPTASSTPPSPVRSVRNVFTFPNNTFIENIAVRSNSRLLITSMSVPTLFTLNPTLTNPTSSILYTFPNASGLAGVAEVKPDVFAVVSGIWDLYTTRAQLGSLQVWTIDLTKPTPAVKLIATIANSTIFNGLARHPSNPDLLLAADSELGAVWRVNLKTGAYGIALSSPLLAPQPGNPLGTNMGINGLKAAGAQVFFTNSGQRIFGKIPVDAQGNQAGAVVVLANSTVAGASVVYDDFALTGGDGAWIASHPSQAVRVATGGAQFVVDEPSTLFNPTAAALGRGSPAQEKTVYVTNGGRFVFTDTEVGFDLVDNGVAAVLLK